MKSVVVRRAEVTARDGEMLRLRLLEGPLSGSECDGALYSQFGDAPDVGSVVLANTVGLEMDLGTGGLAFVMPGESGEAPVNRDHFVKLPYTPLQFPVGGESVERRPNLIVVSIVVLPLHSHLAPACCAAREAKPDAKVSFVWQEGGALPVGVSRVVPELKELGLLGRVVSSGSCFGGDVESPNLYDALLAAAVGVDLVLVGIGPGIVGTGREFAHGGMSSAFALDAASALGGSPVLAPRISEADERERHRGISHHTLSALRVTHSGCRVAVPSGKEFPHDDLPDRHTRESVDYTASGLEDRYGLTFRSMGRGYRDDPVFFDAAACAVRLAMGGAV